MRVRTWQVLLRFFYAGLFGLVLPFVCWGAQATPGHPHARAHVVFWPPEPVQVGPISATPTSLQDLLRGAPICGSHTATPAGLSTPPVLAIFLLLLVLAVSGTDPRNDAPGFAGRQAALLVRWVALRCELPPPRRLCMTSR